jgi:hypothetical protein
MRGIVGKKRIGKEMDGCPLTLSWKSMGYQGPESHLWSLFLSR